MAPKLEKKGFCERREKNMRIKGKTNMQNATGVCIMLSVIERQLKLLTGDRLNPD